jgi:hypothetical protein
VFDCVLNYALLCTSMTGWLIYASFIKRSTLAPSYRQCSTEAPLQTTPTFTAAGTSFIFLVVFQISLCLLLHCSGISIIWCGIAGWMLTEVLSFDRWQCPRSQLRNYSLYSLGIPLFFDVFGILFYAITAEVITSVAHVCALVLGAVLYCFSSKLRYPANTSCA